MVTRSAAWSAAGRRKNGKSGGKPLKNSKRRHGPLQISAGLQNLVVFADEDSRAENGGPKAALVADSGLRDVHGADDFVGNTINLFFFVEAEIRVEFHVEGGGEHFGGQLFGIFPGDFFGLAERMAWWRFAVRPCVV